MLIGDIVRQKWGNWGEISPLFFGRFPPLLPFLGALIFFFLVLLPLQRHIDHLKAGESDERDLFLPAKEHQAYIKAMSLGYEQLVADLVWLRLIQEFGRASVPDAGGIREDPNLAIKKVPYDWIYSNIDLVTTLDPDFSYAYKTGGIMLSIFGDLPKKAIALLQKGEKDNPDVWEFPFYIGFNEYFFLEDYKLAAEDLARAARIPGRPDFIPRLASRLYLQAGDPEAAIEFLLRAIEESKDQKVVDTLLQRIKDIREGKVTGLYKPGGEER